MVVVWAVADFPLPRQIGGARERAGGREGRRAAGGRSGGYSGLVESAGNDIGDISLEQREK